MLRRVVASMIIGFVVTIVATGLYPVSENVYYRGVGYDRLGQYSRPTQPPAPYYAQNIGFGFPFNWIKTRVPATGCLVETRYGSCILNGVMFNFVPNVEVNWASFALDISLLAVSSYPLTFLSSRIAPMLRTADDGKSRLKDRIVISASILCLGWLIVYLFAGNALAPIGRTPLWNNYLFFLGSISDMNTPLLLLFSALAIVGVLLATWKSTLGGIISALSGLFLLLFPGLLQSMFLFNPEFAMLYVLWTSTMVAGGLGSLLAGVHHAYVMRAFG